LCKWAYADILKEAAATHALAGLDPHSLNIGDSFVLCDAGGGTVDLIAYTFTQLQPVLQVKEAAAGRADSVAQHIEP
jgi:hypothetical protein